MTCGPGSPGTPPAGAGRRAGRRCGPAPATSSATPPGSRCASWDAARSSSTASSSASTSSSSRSSPPTPPACSALYGVGPDTAALLLIAAGRPPGRLRSEAAWAHLCAAAPIPASSGKTVRHRLNPGGDRQANHALWRIVITRMSSHPPTRAYVERRIKEGLSKTEIIRCLKRYVAREVYPHLRPPAADTALPGAAWPTNRLPHPCWPANDSSAVPGATPDLLGVTS